MILMFRISLNHFSPTQLMIEAFSLDNYVRAAQDPYYQEIILTTLGMALLCTALTLVIAYPAAYWVGRLQSRWKSLVVIATLFPLLVGNVVRSAGWMALFTRDGPDQYDLLKAACDQRAAGIDVYAEGRGVRHRRGGAALHDPDHLRRDREHPAGSGGCRRQSRRLRACETFWRVILPLSAPGVAAGSILVFVLCMNTYATAVLLGGPRFKMMAPAIFDQFVRGNNWPMGAALAFMLLAVTMSFTIFGSIVFARRYRVR